jgi:hypothetical protein
MALQDLNKEVRQPKWSNSAVVKKRQLSPTISIQKEVKILEENK